MKSLLDEKIEFITPCFCAGAHQSKAEIRAASIRGELRWWFRVLGGSPEQEKNVFGGISKGSDQAVSGALVVRIRDVVKSKEKTIALPKNLNFFTSSREGNAIPPKTTFRLLILQRRPIDSADLLNLTIKTFLMLGSIGMRSNRGTGALQKIADRPDESEFISWRKNNTFLANGLDIYNLKQESSALNALKVLEEEIRSFRVAEEIEPNSKSPLGWVKGDQRHSSCLRVRPLALSDDKFLPVVFYTERPLANGVRSIRKELRKHFSEN